MNDIASQKKPDGTVATSREYAFTDADFRALRDLVKEMTGISLSESKQELVYARVSRRLRALGLGSFGEYRKILERADAPELVEFCNALTTNLTSFFRESHHFDYLRDEFLAVRARDARGSRRIRIWSAACSSGEEPYSIAMTICETIADWQKWDIKILATDLDSNVLAVGQRGIYQADRVKAIAPQRMARFFRESRDGAAKSYEMAPELKGMITFKQINLMHELPMSGPLDAIFCRNVIIYFDKETQRGLFARIARTQRQDDLLFLGHSENIFNITNDYALLGKTIYRRTGA
jgi:chemotaxis protein methyltransferase CheR